MARAELGCWCETCRRYLVSSSKVLEGRLLHLSPNHTCIYLSLTCVHLNPSAPWFRFLATLSPLSFYLLLEPLFPYNKMSHRKKDWHEEQSEMGLPPTPASCNKHLTSCPSAVHLYSRWCLSDFLFFPQLCRLSIWMHHPYPELQSSPAVPGGLGKLVSWLL